MATLQSLLVRLGIDADDFKGGLSNAQKSLASFRDDLVENTRGIEDFGNALSGLGRSTALSSLAASAAGLSAAVVPAAGSLLLLPGAAAAGGAAMGTLNVAMSGFGETLSNIGDPEKFAESLKQLAPAAREAALAVSGLAPRWDELATSVQDAAFDGIAEKITALGGTYLPILETGMTGIAGGFNNAAMEAAQFGRNAQTIADVEAILGDTSAAVGNLTGVVQPLLSVFRDVAAVGTGMLPDLTSGAAEAANSFADFIAQARETGRLEGWIRGGLDVLRQLREIAGNVGDVLAAIFPHAASSGQDLLDTITQLTAKLATWASSAEGQAQIAATFDTLGQVMGHLLVILPLLAGALTTVSGWIAALPAPVQSLITGFLAWSLVIGVLVARFAPLFSLLSTLGGRFLAAAVSSETATGRLVRALGRGAKAVAVFAMKVTAGALRIVAQILWFTLKGAARITWFVVTTLAKVVAWSVRIAARFAVMAAQALARLTVMTAQVAARFAVMAARSLAQVLIMTARVAVQFAVMAARGLASMAMMAARVVARWAFMAAGAMARAAIMAAAWFVAMGPIGWVIAAVIGLVALIIANWDKVKAFTIAAFQAIWSFLQSVWNNIVSAVTAAGKAVWNTLRDAFTSAKDAVVSAATGIFTFVASIPGRILSALGNLGSLLVNAGKQIIQGLIDGLMSAVGWLQDKLSWITNLIPDWKGPIRVDARLLQPTGQVIMQGLVEGIDTGADDVHRKLGSVTAQIARTPTPAAPRLNRGEDHTTRLVAALRAAVVEGMPDELVLDEQGGRVIARAVNRVNRVQNRR